MNFNFSQTAEICLNTIIKPDCLNNLPYLIQQHTDFTYLYEQRESGCFLKPCFRNMPYRNSFVPELNITLTQDNGKSCLHIKGQPVKFVLWFTTFFFIFASTMELLVIIIALTSGLDSIFIVFIPVLIGVFNYSLCKILTKLTFKSIVNAIKEFI